MTDVVQKIASAFPSLKTSRLEPMSRHTSFRIGGKAALMCFPESEEQTVSLIKLLHELGVEPLFMGNGTNMLVSDTDLDICVIKLHGGLESIELSGECEIACQSGVLLSRLAVFACEHALAGLEFAHGIPGTVGGAVSMNAGAYGGEMKDVVIRTTAVDACGNVFEIEGDQHDFSYRHSCFSDKNVCILRSVIRLSPGDKDEIRARMDDLMSRRRSSQPLNLPSAGSTFKRPENGYAAAMIDAAGLKGRRVGGACVSEKHAGFIVNDNNATFSDVCSLMDIVRETVNEKYGVILQPEVKIIK